MCNFCSNSFPPYLRQLHDSIQSYSIPAKMYQFLVGLQRDILPIGQFQTLHRLLLLISLIENSTCLISNFAEVAHNTCPSNITFFGYKLAFGMVNGRSPLSSGPFSLKKKKKKKRKVVFVAFLERIDGNTIFSVKMNCGTPKHCIDSYLQIFSNAL